MRYLVEMYQPSAADPLAAEAAARAAAAATEVSADPVQYVESIFVPSDEVCFHLLEALSPEAVRRALDAGSIAYERIVATAATAGP